MKSHKSICGVPTYNGPYSASIPCEREEHGTYKLNTAAATVHSISYTALIQTMNIVYCHYINLI